MSLRLEPIIYKRQAKMPPPYILNRVHTCIPLRISTFAEYGGLATSIIRLCSADRSSSCVSWTQCSIDYFERGHSSRWIFSQFSPCGRYLSGSYHQWQCGLSHDAWSMIMNCTHEVIKGDNFQINVFNNLTDPSMVNQTTVVGEPWHLSIRL